MEEKANIDQKKVKRKKKIFESYTKYALTETDYKKLLRACNKKEDQILLQLAVEMGFRRLDISKLLISNIDKGNKKIRFHEHKKDTKDKDGKIIEKWRTLPVPDDLFQEILMYLQTLPDDQKYLFKWGKSEFGDITAYRRFNDLCVIAGIPKRAFHALRGTCYKFKKARGWSVEQAAAWLGDSVEIALQHYGTPSDSELEQLVRGKI